MYLRRITLKNAGPISDLSLEMPFDGDTPKPIVFVGQNGSGKTTLISFIVNAIIAIKQNAFDNAEVKQGRVYRLRSTLAIHGNMDFYFSNVQFDDGVFLKEWQLQMPKSFFTNTSYANVDGTWDQIPGSSVDYLQIELSKYSSQPELQQMISNNCFLYFPSDRFEPPDWLNSPDLSPELALPEPVKVRGQTARRIIQKNRLKPILEWLLSVYVDMRNFAPNNLSDILNINQAFIRAVSAFGVTNAVLISILCKQGESGVIEIGDRFSRLLSYVIKNGDIVSRVIKDLSGLSAGESALFCAFAAIIQDADLARMAYVTPNDIPGIVIIDEADLHLHVGFQYTCCRNSLQCFQKSNSSLACIRRSR